MDNRNRDNMSKESGNVNRNTSQEIGSRDSDSSASFGKNIGRSENLENEPSRRSGSMSGDKSSSNSSSESGWQSSGGKRSNLGEQSDVESSSSSRQGSEKSYGDKRGEH